MDIIDTEEILAENDEEMSGKEENEANHILDKENKIPYEPIGKKARKRKEEKINEALSLDPPDLSALKELAQSKGGLLTDELRRKVWPKFLNLDLYEVSPKPRQEEINAHPEYNQVDLDVQRSLRRFPPDIPQERRMALQNQLTSLIIRILIKHKELHYYQNEDEKVMNLFMQGYHDICVTFLLVLGEELAFASLEKLSMTKFRIFMEPTMESTIKFVNLIGTMVEKFSPELYSHLVKGEVSPVFCLSWLITWFGHVLNDYRRIVRLYDFFLSTHQLMPIYLATTVILHRQDKALALEPDMATLHHFLCNVPDDLPFESLVPEAAELCLRYPPSQVLKDSVKALRREKGFYHRWTERKRGNTLTRFVWNKLASISNAIVPSYVQRHWFLAVSVIVPLVFAIGYYSLYLSKTPSLATFPSPKKHL